MTLSGVKIVAPHMRVTRQQHGSGWAATPSNPIGQLLRADSDLPKGLATQVNLVRAVHQAIDYRVG